MFEVLGSAKIGLNRHVVDVAGHFANNMRLFEATGMGTCLLTDMKSNLGELFEVDREVVAYENTQDLMRHLAYLLDHPAERRAIADAGQARTLRDHTYRRRMEQ